MSEETSYVLLGALIALLVVLVAFTIFVGTVTTRAIGYAARFKGFQAGRNAQNEMTFTAKIDESPRGDEERWEDEPDEAAADEEGHELQ